MTYFRFITFLAALCLFVDFSLGATPEVLFSKKQLKDFIVVQAPLAGKDAETWLLALETRFLNSEYPLPAKRVKMFVAEMTAIKDEPKAGLQPLNLRVRAKYSDVLATEDPTVKASDKPPAKSENLKGASFNFTHDAVNDAQKWQIAGSVILPIKFYGDTSADGSNWTIPSWGYVPSVSFNQVRDDAKPQNDVDSVIYRVGTFVQIFQPNLSTGDPGSFAHQIRGYASFGTDWNHDISIPVSELEWEPQINFNDSIAIGYQKALWWRSEADAHVSIEDDALFAYQLRFWIHIEAGEVVRNAGNLNLPEESFFRAGPVAELSLTPFFFKNLSVTAGYRYFGTLSGFSDIPYLFDATLAWTLWRDPNEKARKVDLKLSYLDGGQEFTQLRQRLTTLGFAITF